MQCIEGLQVRKLYSCRAASLSFTDYCKCEGVEVLCCNPFTYMETKKTRRRQKEIRKTMMNRIKVIECDVIGYILRLRVFLNVFLFYYWVIYWLISYII